jgi:hypothetical protein
MTRSNFIKSTLEQALEQKLPEPLLKLKLKSVMDRFLREDSVAAYELEVLLSDPANGLAYTAILARDYIKELTDRFLVEVARMSVAHAVLLFDNANVRATIIANNRLKDVALNRPEQACLILDRFKKYLNKDDLKVVELFAAEKTSKATVIRPEKKDELTMTPLHNELKKEMKGVQKGMETFKRDIEDFQKDLQKELIFLYESAVELRDIVKRIKAFFLEEPNAVYDPKFKNLIQRIEVLQDNQDKRINEHALKTLKYEKMLKNYEHMTNVFNNYYKQDEPKQNESKQNEPKQKTKSFISRFFRRATEPHNAERLNKQGAESKPIKNSFRR